MKETIAAIHAGKRTRNELDLLRALVEIAKEKALAEQRVLSLAGELGAWAAKLWTLEAKHAPKKRGRPALPKDHIKFLENPHFRVLKRLAEAGDHGLQARDFKLPGLTDKTLQRVLRDLRDRELVELEGKRWRMSRDA